MEVPNEVRWYPRRRSVRREGDLHVIGQIVHPGVKGRVELHKIWIDPPILLLLDFGIDIIHSTDVADKLREECKASSNMIF